MRSPWQEWLMLCNLLSSTRPAPGDTWKLLRPEKCDQTATVTVDRVCLADVPTVICTTERSNGTSATAPGRTCTS
eukprot:365838-Chlamydomonas_euryale.AAC.3